MCFFFHVFFSYIDLLDESQTKLSSDLLDSRQSISQIQVIYIIISWVKNVRGELKKILEVFLLVLCTIFSFKLSWLFKCNSSSGLQFSFNMLGILYSFVHKMPDKHLLLSSFWIFFLVAIFVRFFLLPFLGTRKVKSVFMMWLLRPYYFTQFFLAASLPILLRFCQTNFYLCFE